MKTKTTKWLGAAALTLALTALGAGRAGAVTNPAYLYIDVTIVSSLSVQVAGAAASTVTANYNASGAVMSNAGAVGVAVTNNSAYSAERWELNTTAFSADSTNGNTGWTIAAANGSETAELQALFVSAANVCPPNAAAEWSGSSDALSTTQTQYTSTTLVDSAASAFPDVLATSRLNPSSVRGLCYKVTGPTATGLSNMQIVPVVVTAF